MSEFDFSIEEPFPAKACSFSAELLLFKNLTIRFFVTFEENRVVFNEINTLPGFTSISMYPKLFAASGIPYGQLIDELLKLAMEA